MDWRDYQLEIAEWTKDTCKENRMALMKMLLSNLNPEGLRHVQNLCSKCVKNRKWSTEDTRIGLDVDEDEWCELDNSERLTNWAGYTRQDVLIAYIKLILSNYREKEVREIRSTWTYRARQTILHPERVVSRRQSVPAQVGWWSAYPLNQIIAVDCEMVAKIVGRKSNGKPKCKNVVGTVSVVAHDGKVIFKRIVKHHPSEIYLTPEMERITGFKKNSFVNGTDITIVRTELAELFQGKLLILIGAGSDFAALDMKKGDFDVFDLHQHYTKDSGNIGLRSLVYHFYRVDIQSGIHDPDDDAKYTMKIFIDQYIPDKTAHPDESESRYTMRKFNDIVTIK